MGISYRIKTIKTKKEWRRRNNHNGTVLGWTTNIDCISVGKYTYGCLNVLNESKEYNLKIGSFCSIAPDVTFIVCSDHRMDLITSFPIKSAILKEQNTDAISKGSIIIDDDVWIGYGATVLSGVHVGQGAVLASGSMVTHDVPPYAVVGGIPAKVLKYRFPSTTIDFLLTLDYSKLDERMIRKHTNDLYNPIINMKPDEIKEVFSWFPKKTGVKKLF